MKRRIRFVSVHLDFRTADDALFGISTLVRTVILRRRISREIQHNEIVFKPRDCFVADGGNVALLFLEGHGAMKGV